MAAKPKKGTPEYGQAALAAMSGAGLNSGDIMGLAQNLTAARSGKNIGNFNKKQNAEFGHLRTMGLDPTNALNSLYKMMQQGKQPIPMGHMAAPPPQGQGSPQPNVGNTLPPEMIDAIRRRLGSQTFG